MDQVEMINKLMAKVDEVLWAPYTGPDSAGNPMARGVVIINGHRVDVYAIQGATDKKLRFELDKSTKPHTLAEAIAVIVS